MSIAKKVTFSTQHQARLAAASAAAAADTQYSSVCRPRQTLFRTASVDTPPSSPQPHPHAVPGGTVRTVAAAPPLQATILPQPASQPAPQRALPSPQPAPPPHAQPAMQPAMQPAVQTALPLPGAPGAAAAAAAQASQASLAVPDSDHCDDASEMFSDDAEIQVNDHAADHATSSSAAIPSASAECAIPAAASADAPSPPSQASHSLPAASPPAQPLPVFPPHGIRSVADPGDGDSLINQKVVTGPSTHLLSNPSAYERAPLRKSIRQQSKKRVHESSNDDQATTKKPKYRPTQDMAAGASAGAHARGDDVSNGFSRFVTHSGISINQRQTAAIADLIEKLQGHPIWAFLIAPEQNMPKIVLNGSKQKKIVGFKGALENKQIKDVGAIMLGQAPAPVSFRTLALDVKNSVRHMKNVMDLIASSGHAVKTVVQGRLFNRLESAVDDFLASIDGWIEKAQSEIDGVSEAAGAGAGGSAGAGGGAGAAAGGNSVDERRMISSEFAACLKVFETTNARTEEAFEVYRENNKTMKEMHNTMKDMVANNAKENQLQREEHAKEKQRQREENQRQREEQAKENQRQREENQRQREEDAKRNQFQMELIKTLFQKLESKPTKSEDEEVSLIDQLSQVLNQRKVNRPRKSYDTNASGHATTNSAPPPSTRQGSAAGAAGAAAANVAPPALSPVLDTLLQTD